MEKFEVLKYNQISMGWLGIHSKRLNEPTNEFFRSFVAFFILFNVVSFTIISSVVYVYIHIHSFEMIAEPFLDACCGTQVAGMFICIGINMKKVKKLHLVLQELVDKDRKEVFNIYWQVEQKCRKYTKIIACFPLNLIFVGTLIYSIVCIANGNRDTSTWKLLYFFSLPIDRDTIHRWYIFWYVDTSIGVTYSLILITISTYFVCCCFYLGGICDHFDFLTYSLNEEVKQLNKEKNVAKYQQKYGKMKDNVAQTVNIHIKLYEIFNMVADLNSGVIFWLLPAN
ncbi:uncharacterized protein LOC116350104, partial [Contarinia nasturtii]|uniref:uncharacterized protein LOC116350104 n=1 Tax=Contarinia nasturtii TaxID=265458 RepID=UPI0012D37D6E